MTKMASKGQVTIPKRVRDYLGLKPGSNVDFELAAGGASFSPSTEKRPKAGLPACGSAKPGMTTDELMALTRGEGAD